MTENKNTHTDSRLQIEARNNPRVAFGLRWEEADEKVQKIKDYLDSLYDHTGPIHWGHVGDMSRLNGYLDLALQLIGLAPKD